MVLIALRQLLEGFKDSIYLFSALLLVVAFAFNGIIYSEKIEAERTEWLNLVNYNNAELSKVCDNLQMVAGYKHKIIRPVSSLKFIADDGAAPVANVIEVSAFTLGNTDTQSPHNEQILFIGNFDWSFILGILTTLVTLLISYSTINGERSKGTLKMVLAYPVSRMSLFLGKYLGILLFVCITIVVGSLVSILVLMLNGALTVSVKFLSAYCWAIFSGLLLCSLVLLFAMTFSSLTEKPSISLIICLALWTLVFIVYPGFSQLLSTGSDQVKTPIQLQRAYEARDKEVRSRHPDEATNYYGPEGKNMHLRMHFMQDTTEAMNQVTYEHYKSKVQHFRQVRTIAALSPVVILQDMLQSVADTNHYGYHTLVDNGRRFRQILWQFIINKDESDPESLHWVYGNDGRADSGTFSSKPVRRSELPVWTLLWDTDGLPRRPSWPVFQLSLLLFLNLGMAILAFISFARCDPR